MIDEAKIFDKRNESNAQIMMSVDNSDLIVDINSLKDEKEISMISNGLLSFQEEDSNIEFKTSKKRLKDNKITPDEMLRRMNDKIEE